METPPPPPDNDADHDADNNADQEAGPALPAPPTTSSFSPPPLAPRAVSPAASVAHRRAGVLVTLGGVLVVLGVFLPWVSASGFGVSVSENGIKIGTFGTLILGAFAVARGLSLIRPSSFAINLGTPLIGGILIGVLVALRWSFLQSEVRDAHAGGFQASIGIGVWSVIAGTVLILAGGLLAQRRS